MCPERKTTPTIPVRLTYKEMVRAWSIWDVPVDIQHQPDSFRIQIAHGLKDCQPLHFPSSFSLDSYMTNSSAASLRGAANNGNSRSSKLHKWNIVQWNSPEVDESPATASFMGNWFKDQEKARRERDDDHARAVEGVKLSEKTLQGKCKGPKGFSITYPCFTGRYGFFQRS